MSKKINHQSLGGLGPFADLLDNPIEKSFKRETEELANLDAAAAAGKKVAIIGVGSVRIRIASQRAVLMPRFDLRQDDQTLKPLAPFQVLAVMCCPTDRVRREKMMAHIQAGTGLARPRRHPLSGEEYRSEVRLGALKGVIAGGLLVTRLQLHLNGYAFSLARAMPLVRTLLPDWQPPYGGRWPKDANIRQWPHSRRKMLAAYDAYRSVAHLWAALIHGGQQERKDIWPGSLDTVPILLSYAEAILEIASRLPSPHRDQRFALTRSEVWSFIVPQKLVLHITLGALPLNAQQRQILNEL